MEDDVEDETDTNIGRKLFHTISGHGGVVHAEAEHPNGDVLVRLNDQWFMLADCVEWEQA